MNPKRSEQIEQPYHSSLEQTPDQRQAFLRDACKSDEELPREVKSLLTPLEATLPLSLPTANPSVPMGEAPRPQLAADTQLGPYRIETALGAGGMGEVYRAMDTRLGRKVAIKISQERFSARFEREARMISALNHPHICTLYDVGPNYIVTELVEGETLGDWLRRAPPVESRLEVAKQILEALRAAHSAGIIHRDLKPANIMVRFDGYVKVLDFGLAKRISASGELEMESNAAADLSLAGHILGTVAYMSPEQIRGLAIDQRCDLFAFGILLYEILTGQHPWPRPSSIEVLHAILHDDPPPINASLLGVNLPAATLERILRRCLAKQPAQRFQTIVELRQALEKAATELASRPGEHHASIAVLPFANMSADKENEYFGDGLAEEVINVLAHVPGMKVAGRTSSFFFRGKDIEFREIGRRLNVEHILEGSVRKAGNRIRVTAQLIQVTDGFHLWSERYDREMTDIFAIQDEITQAIAGCLRLKLSPDAGTLGRQAPNLRAYEAYLKAREQWLKPTPESLAQVKRYLEHAIELDPKFALAYSLLGAHYTMLANLGITPAHEAIPLARAAEQQALRLEPSLPEAHALLGVCAGTDYDWKEAERQWRLAMAHEPVSRDVRFWYGNHYLLPIGRPVEAVEAMSRTLEEDPLNLLYRQIFAVGLRYVGRIDDAEAELRKILEVDENFPLAVSALGAVCAQQGRFEEALTLTERAYALMPWGNPIIGQLAALLLHTGATSRADALIKELVGGKAYGTSTALAVFHAMCGEFDQAAEWAEQAILEGYPRLVPILGPLLRSSAKWPALVKLMNLPA